MSDRNQRFANKSIVITGAGKGLGRAAALAFAREGGAITIGDVDLEQANAVVDEISAAGGRAQTVSCDVRSP